jgi:hypothetical protein
MRTEQANNLPRDQRFCTRCDKPLRGKFAWLEKDCWVADGYHCHEGEVAPERSQGWFPMGLSCARKYLSKGAKP